MKVMFTGGGTAGHAMVNTILIPYMQEKGVKASYIGSKQGIEKEMIGKFKDVSYHPIISGKLRRYFSMKNITDIFNIFIGFFQASSVLKKEKVDVLYSCGGYVSVPVVWAAYFQDIPIIIRETDYSIGLANRLSLFCGTDLFLTFSETDTTKYDIPVHNKGMIIRPELIEVKERMNRPLPPKPILLVLGGSQGAAAINEFIWKNLTQLTENYRIIHMTGKGKGNQKVNAEDYEQFEFIEDISEYYAMADIVMTRSGSNVISECLLLGKRMVCVPLTSSQSRGEQSLNANFAKKYGNAVILDNDELNLEQFLPTIDKLLEQEEKGILQVSSTELQNRIEEHIAFILDKISLKKAQ